MRVSKVTSRLNQLSNVRSLGNLLHRLAAFLIMRGIGIRLRLGQQLKVEIVLFNNSLVVSTHTVVIDLSAPQSISSSMHSRWP